MPQIKKIVKLRNLGVYNEFSCSGSFPEFKEYNVIYGWNGTGKTTLSRLFGSLNSGSHPDFPSLAYEVKDSEGKIHTQGVAFPAPIKVFNSDFIADNIDFRNPSSKAIDVILGKENKDTLRAIRDDEAELAEVEREINRLTADKHRKLEARGEKFTGIARVIGQVRQGGVIRNYNKNSAEKAFKTLSQKELLDSDLLEKLSKSVLQTPLPTQAELSLGDCEAKLLAITTDAKNLLNRTVEAAVLERLRDNDAISKWVEEGIAIHGHYKSENCEFCGERISSRRLAELMAHFNKADSELKVEIETLAGRLLEVRNKITEIAFVDKMNFYEELRDEYEKKSKLAAFERDLLLRALEEFDELLESKKLITTKALTIRSTPSLVKLSVAVNDLNETIKVHNRKTDNFIDEQKIDGEKIERHYLSKIFDDVILLDSQMEELDRKIALLSSGGDDLTGAEKLKIRIAGNKTEVSSSHKACDLLTTYIAKFLGNEEISFTPNKDDTGYQILRRDSPAKSLSEGEQTAIAFVYFVTQLHEVSFASKGGIVVVDDPISSLDSNSQYQAFSFLKKATEGASQLFILTHNFDFLKMVLGWVKHSGKSFALFMIKNSFSEINGSRTAYIDKLDESLEKFESEYQYLFKIAFNYMDDGTIANAYKMPNIARKLLEGFLMFRVPKNEKTFNRLKEIKFDSEKKAAIYKFANDQSHITGSGFDPSLVPETKKCLAYLLEMIEAVDPEHYKHLKESIS